MKSINITNDTNNKNEESIKLEIQSGRLDPQPWKESESPYNEMPYGGKLIEETYYVDLERLKKKSFFVAFYDTMSKKKLTYEVDSLYGVSMWDDPKKQAIDFAINNKSRYPDAIKLISTNYNGEIKRYDIEEQQK